MILSKAKVRKLRYGDGLFVLSGVLALVALFAVSRGPSQVTESPDAQIVFCDAETVDSTFFVKGENNFLGGAFQSDRRAYSGNYSCALGGDRQYGIGYIMENPEPGRSYRASVWVFRTSGKRGRLAVSAPDDLLYKEESIPVYKNKDGWELVQLYFTVPSEGPETVRVYTYVSKGSGDIFFDDFKLVPLGQQLTDDGGDFPSTMLLNLDHKAYKKLDRKKWDAIATGILITEEDDWVDGVLRTSSTEALRAEVRLKGDWLDHIREDKWSMRIKLKDPGAWRGMTTFSVQSPETRFYLREWIYHKFLEAVDVLTPRYDFTAFSLNDKDLGIYAVEEHFEKQLVESSRRREGPIIKLAEEGFWYGYKLQEDYYGKGTIEERMSDAYWESEIQPFKENRTQRNPVLTSAFEHAQNLLYSYKYDKLPALAVFDIEATARYYAMTDVHQAYHGIAWHNQRFYYNPVLSKLEPIGFDGFGELNVTDLGHGPFLGYYVRSVQGRFFSKLFRDPAFVRRYQYYLDKFTDMRWFDARLLEMESQIDERNQLLAMEFDDSTLDVEELRNRVRKLRWFLRPMDNVSLLARTQRVDGQHKIVRLINKYCLAIDVIGYAGSDRDNIRYLEKKQFIPQGEQFGIPPHAEIRIPAYARYIYFQLAGVDSTHVTTISPFKAPEIPQLPEVTEVSHITDKFPFMERTGREAIVITAGEHVIDENCHLPAGVAMIVRPGANLDIVNGASVIVRGPVMAIGQPDAPIRISSSDNSASGFTVLRAPARSELQYVVFDGLNTINSEGWVLTGAVTFYESDVTMRNCSFLRSQCEDALNTMRCDVDIDGILVADALFDGFDLDFCTGSIDNAIFRNSGNDAIDFSGSSILVRECVIDSAGDKGISVGEDADVKVLKADISRCNIAVASKDLSHLIISQVAIRNCQQGFTAYRKKPEFGPARLTVEMYTMDDVKQPYLIEKGSVLRLGDRNIAGE